MEYSGLWRRIGAAILDSMILGIFYGILSKLFNIFYIIIYNIEPQPITLITLGILNIVMYLQYYSVMLSSIEGRTLGMKVVRIRAKTVDGDRVAYLRSLSRYLISMLPSWILLYTPYKVMIEMFFTNKTEINSSNSFLVISLLKSLGSSFLFLIILQIFGVVAMIVFTRKKQSYYDFLTSVVFIRDVEKEIFDKRDVKKDI